MQTCLIERAGSGLLTVTEVQAVNNKQEPTKTTRFFIEIIPRCIYSLKLDFGVLHTVYLDSPPVNYRQVHLLGRGTATEF